LSITLGSAGNTPVGVGLGIIGIESDWRLFRARNKRHTFSTHQIHNGLKINQLKEVLGHRRMETTYKYVHVDRTNLRAEMEQGAL
jgi:integrase